MEFMVPHHLPAVPGAPGSEDPDVIANRPALAPTGGSSYATDELLDAQSEWQAHIDAGRIEVR